MTQKKGTAPDTQGTPGEEGGDSGGGKLFAGKYKTVEEMEAAYATAEQRLTDLSGRLDTAERLLSVLDAPQDGGTTPDPQGDQGGTDVGPVNFEEAFPEPNQRKALYVYGQAIATKVAKQVAGHMESRFEQERNSQANAQIFYVEHPDLKSWEDVVGNFAVQVQGELRGRRIDPVKGRAEVARRSREYIDGLKRRMGVKGNTPPNVLSGGSGSNDQEPDNQDDSDLGILSGKGIPDPKEGVDDWMNESRKFRAPRSMPPR